MSQNLELGITAASVMVGEIGEIKRDIAFSGDVLNTTSRIQGLCGEFGLDILASVEFANLNDSLPSNVRLKTLGKEKLRGKLTEIELVTYARN